MQINIDKRSSYNEIHIIMLLRSLKKKPKGRMPLSKELSLGESTIRTMLNTLKTCRLTKSTTRGETLTKKGQIAVDTINSKISQPYHLDIKAFTLHGNNIGHTLRGHKTQTTNITDIRDSAIKMGAEGLILISKEETQKIIGMDDNNIEIPKTISSTMTPEKGDTIIITFAKSRNASELAGLGIAIELSGFSIDITDKKKR